MSKPKPTYTTCAKDGGAPLLMKTIKAWQRHLDEVKDGRPHTDENRHDAWVPAL